MRIALRVVLFLLIASAVFLSISYHVYYLSPAADLPCRNCTGDARAVHVNGFDLYFYEIGAKTDHPPIVVVHGGPGSSSAMFKNSFDFLADTYRVIYYDQRGSGYSQIKPDPSYYTIDQLVEELETIRRDEIGSDKMVLIGHSAGGALVQRYALRYSERVEKMVLIASIPANGGRKKSGALVEAYFAALDILGGTKLTGDPEEINAWFKETSSEGLIQRLYDPGNASLLKDTGYSSYVTFREVWRSTLGGDFDESLRQLTVNTLLIYGAADSFGTGEFGMEAIHHLLPNSRLVRFERSGHWPFLEQPDKFQRELRSFLESE